MTHAHKKKRVPSLGKSQHVLQAVQSGSPCQFKQDRCNFSLQFTSHYNVAYIFILAKCECSLAGSATKTASSSLSDVFSPDQSGINNAYDSIISNGTETVINGGSWQPSVDDSSPSFILDFGSDKTIRKINTKGNGHFNYWVKKYDLYRKASGDASYSHVKVCINNLYGLSIILSLT